DSLRVYDRVKEIQPDLVLLDIMMPYLDGWDELKLFKLDNELQGLPVIIMTADRLAFQGIDDPGQYGVVDRIFKPFALDDLMAKVEAILKSPANSH
ncbi:MAG: response regulator, partial [Chloroflexota bacterium]|nr:response regulator [Chloroflexota bacterium]